MLKYSGTPQSFGDISSEKPVAENSSPVSGTKKGNSVRRLTNALKAVGLWCWDGYVQAVCRTVYVDEQGHAYSTWVF